MDDPNMNAYEYFFRVKLTLMEWLEERYQNTLRIAKTKSGLDRDGWLEDAEYFKQAMEALAPPPAQSGKESSSK